MLAFLFVVSGQDVKYNSFKCNECLRLGYMWCEKYFSPFATSFCDANI